MKLKKLISLGLVAVLSLSLFTGCGNGNTEQSEKGNSETSQDTQGGTGEEARFVENIYDMGGKTIRIFDHWGNLCRKYDPSTLNRDEVETLKVLEEIEKDYNVKLEVMYDAIDSLPTNVATSAAAGEVYANIIILSTGWLGITGLAESGYLADLATIKNLGLDTNDWGEPHPGLISDGVQIGVGFHTKQLDYQSPSFLVLNKDLEEQYGIEDIYELVRNGEWTWAKFEEICQDITTKSGGAVKGLLSPEGVMEDFILTNNIDVVIEEDGRYVYNGLSDEVVSGLEWTQNFIKKGLFDMETYDAPGLATNGDRSHAFGREHKTLFFECSLSWLISDIDYRLENYGLVPYPNGPANDSGEITGVYGGCMGFHLTKDDPDIEDAAAILVALANRLSLTWDEYVDYCYGRGYIRDDESYEFLVEMGENRIYYHGDAEYIPGDVMSAVVSGESTPRQILEQTAQAAQTTIDEELNNE